MKKADGQRTKNKDQGHDEKFGEKSIDILVVGAGPSGLKKIRELLVQGVSPESIVLVESQDHIGGRSAGGLHLLEASVAEDSAYNVADSFSPAKIRWEKKWVAYGDVDWADDDWLASLPQWSWYLKGSKREFLGLSDELLSLGSESFVHLKTPVSSLEMLSDVAEFKWKAQTSRGTFYCKKVIWAAGMPAFQNAFGKVEAQQYFEGNPIYQKEAADFVGGLSLEIEWPSAPIFEEGFDASSVFALPVRHNSKLSLLLGIVSSATSKLKTLTHVHHELLSDPKELLSFQKSLRRAIKHILSPESQEVFDKLPERWVVSPKVGGHMLGSAWCLGAGVPDSLEFVGDQTLESLTQMRLDLAGLLTQKSSENSAESHPNL